MDEIIIEEKRYISSKQAAKMTGYAKDYIGQLCREGRVPARLVGRSWYVLEAAIQDHRFGTAAVEPEVKAPPEAEVSAPLSSHMQAPRYMAGTEDILPSINELTEPVAAEEEAIQEEESQGNLQDSWHAWFEHANVAPIAVSEPLTSSVEEPETLENESVEVNIPVRAIHHSLYQPEKEEVLPQIVKHYSAPIDIEERYTAPEKPIKARRSMAGAIQMAGIMVAAASVVVAVIGTGYLDTYILGNRSVSFVAGVSLYNK